jgi:nicotinamidase-related amidase
MDTTVLRNHATAPAKMASLSKIPVITTASVPEGPNGPLIPEIHENAPHAQYVAWKGQINAWDNPDFVAAVKATGKRTLSIAGTITSVCMALPAILAVEEGYKVFAVVDASGTYSKMAQEITLARVVQAGVAPIETGAVASEMQRTWNRKDTQEWAEVYTGGLLFIGATQAQLILSVGNDMSLCVRTSLASGHFAVERSEMNERREPSKPTICRGNGRRPWKRQTVRT